MKLRSLFFMRLAWLSLVTPALAIPVITNPTDIIGLERRSEKCCVCVPQPEAAYPQITSACKQDTLSVKHGPADCRALVCVLRVSEAKA